MKLYIGECMELWIHTSQSTPQPKNLDLRHSHDLVLEGMGTCPCPLSRFFPWLHTSFSYYLNYVNITITRFLMKLFKLSNINLINDSRYYNKDQSYWTKPGKGETVLLPRQFGD